MTGTEYGRKTGCEMNPGTVNETCNRHAMRQSVKWAENTDVSF